MERIEVPFTDKQVNSFNEYQKEGQLHPFTCGNDDKTTENHLDGGMGYLIAKHEYLECPYCDYKQHWMHEFMSDFSWKKIKFN